MKIKNSVSTTESHPSFTISKWASSRDGKCSFTELEVSCAQKTSKNSELRHRGSSNFYGIKFRLTFFLYLTTSPYGRMDNKMSSLILDTPEEHDLTINASSTISDSDVSYVVLKIQYVTDTIWNVFFVFL